MTDDLKHRFDQLVADPPPPSGVPSQAVFARVRSVRRRRTAGVVTLAAAAVAVAAVAAGNLTDIKSAPPVSGTPGTPTTSIVASPTASPSETPSTTPTPAKSTPSGVTTTGHTPAHQTPPPSSTNTPAAPPLGVHVVLKPVVNGLTLTMRVTVSGTSLIPTADGGKPLSTDNDFINLLGGTRYFFGDGGESGSDPGAVNCLSGTDPITRQETYTPLDGSTAGTTSPSTHTYAKAGTYRFSYTIKYCGNNGWVPVTKTVKVTVK